MLQHMQSRGVYAWRHTRGSACYEMPERGDGPSGFGLGKSRMCHAIQRLPILMPGCGTRRSAGKTHACRRPRARGSKKHAGAPRKEDEPASQYLKPHARRQARWRCEGGVNARVQCARHALTRVVVQWATGFATCRRPSGRSRTLTPSMPRTTASSGSRQPLLVPAQPCSASMPQPQCLNLNASRAARVQAGERMFVTKCVLANREYLLACTCFTHMHIHIYIYIYMYMYVYR